MHQYIGLILLIIAVSLGMYLATHTQELLNLKLNSPITFRPVNIPHVPGEVIDLSQPQSVKPSISTQVLETSRSVRIAGVRVPTNFNPYWEVELYSNLGRNEVVNITGWTIKSNSGSFIVPKAQEVYSFGGVAGDVRLKSGDRVFLYSAIGTKGNFQINKCIGYIEDRSPFVPSVPKNCPYVSRSEISHLSGACQDYLLSLNVCQNPSANPPVGIDDFACHNLLDKLSYVGCVERYGRDSDFFSGEWRFWLGGQMNIFDRLHDKVQLLDAGGKLVDEYTY